MPCAWASLCPLGPLGTSAPWCSWRRKTIRPGLSTGGAWQTSQANPGLTRLTSWHSCSAGGYWRRPQVAPAHAARSASLASAAVSRRPAPSSTLAPFCRAREARAGRSRPSRASRRARHARETATPRGGCRCQARAASEAGWLAGLMDGWMDGWAFWGFSLRAPAARGPREHRGQGQMREGPISRTVSAPLASGLGPRRPAGDGGIPFPRQGI
eukprot:scaffold168_cov410-Prasinococcus_capsulatus_cf.AAC.3